MYVWPMIAKGWSPTWSCRSAPPGPPEHDNLFFADFLERLLDLAFDRKTSGLGFGENHAAIDDYVELAGLPGFYLCVFTEAGLERRGQTGRARFVASGSAVKNFRCHNLIVAIASAPLKPNLSESSMTETLTQ
jgi:hypothetical protein